MCLGNILRRQAAWPAECAVEGRREYNKKAGFYSGLFATFYTENSTKICLRCGAADLRLSATHGPTTALLHRQRD